MATKYTAEQISQHKTFSGDESKNSVWVSFEGKVYDITKFIAEHPGGEEVLIDNAGVDITAAFTEIGHSEHARKVLEKYYIGDFDGPVATTVARKKIPVAAPAKSEGGSSLMTGIIVVLVAAVAYGVYSSM